MERFIRIRHMGKALLFAVTTLFFLACHNYNEYDSVLDPVEKPGKITNEAAGDTNIAGAFFASDPEGTLVVNNHSAEDLVLFKNTIVKANVLGGVRAATTNDSYRTKRMDEGEYVLRAVTYDNYSANENDVASCQEVYSTLVYVDTNTRVLDIEGTFGSSAYIEFNNVSGKNVEIRKNSYQGTLLAYLLPDDVGKRYYIPEDDYFLHPVFRFYFRGRIISVQGNAGDVLMRHIDASGWTLTINPPTNITYPMGYIIITNNYHNGLILRNGSQERYTYDGIRIVNPSGTEGVYEFADTGVTYSTLAVYTAGLSDVALPSFTLNAGWEYFYTFNADGTITNIASRDMNSVLSEPHSVRASDGASGTYVRVTWYPVLNATNYLIYRSTTSDGTYSLVGESAGTNYDDTSAALGTTYYYKVACENASSSSDQSAFDEGYRGLAPPTGVSASKGTYAGKVRVEWSSVSGATSYYIYRATSVLGTYSFIGSTTGTYYDDTAVTANQSYYYKVKAYSSTYGTSGASVYDDGYAMDSTYYESEPNDSFSWATQVPGAMLSLECTLTTGDYDYFLFTPSTSGYYTFETTGSLDTYMYLYSSSQTLQTSDDDSGSSLNASINYYLYSGTTYYIVVKGYSDSQNGDYTLTTY